MKSSHSGIPILSPVDAVVLEPPVLLLDVAPLLELSAAVLLLLVSVLLQPMRMAAHKIEKTRRDFLNIGFYSPSRLIKIANLDYEIKGSKSGGMIHENLRNSSFGIYRRRLVRCVRSPT